MLKMDEVITNATANSFCLLKDKRNIIAVSINVATNPIIAAGAMLKNSGLFSILFINAKYVISKYAIDRKTPAKDPIVRDIIFFILLFVWLSDRNIILSFRNNCTHQY